MMIDGGFGYLQMGKAQWELLQTLNPQEVCLRAGIQWDTAGFYVVPFLNTIFKVNPSAARIESNTGTKLLKDSEFTLLILTYLTAAKNIPLKEQWVSEKDLKGGSFFFKGPHALPTRSLVCLYGYSAEKFLEDGTALGGISVPGYGDAAIQFNVLPRIPALIILWAADDEFPARISILFDPTIELHLPLDVILAFVHCLSIAIEEYSGKAGK